MSSSKRYPRINIRSKNELAKRISGSELSFSAALKLINDVAGNFDNQWYDSRDSEPGKGKFVRSAVGTPLGELLRLIDEKVLAPHDHLVPGFIFGGLSNRNHIQAAYHLLGTRRNRTLLRLDISRFFEQIHEDRVYNFFYAKCGCSQKAARLLARLCCVPLGPKEAGGEEKSLARGFATSSRLSLWCNLELFLKLNQMAKKELRNHDPRIAIYVDDIGIMASRVSLKQMNEFSHAAEAVLASFDSHQPLPINPAKKVVVLNVNGVEHLGLKLGRNKLSIGSKARSKMDIIRKKLKSPLPKEERLNLIKRYRSYQRYKQQILKTRNTT